jgi:isoamylase
MLSGDTIDVRDFYGRPIQDDTFLMLLNAHHVPVNFVLPGQEEVRWNSSSTRAWRRAFWKPQN